MRNRIKRFLEPNRTLPGSHSTLTEPSPNSDGSSIERSITSRFGPDVEHVLEQVDVLVELVGARLLGVDVAGARRRRADERRAEADGQVERRHLVDVGARRQALQVIQQVRQRVLHAHSFTPPLSTHAHTLLTTKQTALDRGRTDRINLTLTYVSPSGDMDITGRRPEDSGSLSYAMPATDLRYPLDRPHQQRDCLIT